ncbi:MAG: UvrD-helicase domain-containing protein [Betaproteobacteria bacterium]
MTDRIKAVGEDGACLAQDILARLRALDVQHSFLVQAPAGSGKTGLLIQRYLALLAHVDRPERIVAMTFTRKAAAEMRERVVKALHEAKYEVSIAPGQPHAEKTRELARAALTQDARCDWQLLAQPSRLRIVTIDALATALARRAPLATGLGALPSFVDDASAMYARAVRSALAAANPRDPAWRRFLGRLDNDADRAVALLASLLARRDQWLRLPLGAARVELRDELERGLRAETDAALARVHTMLPTEFGVRISESAGRAAAHFATIPAKEDQADKLLLLAADGGIPRVAADRLDTWNVLANFLLTKGDPRFRQSVNVSIGFPAKGKESGGAQRLASVQAMKDLLADARAIPGLAEALEAVRALPPPAYSDSAWAFIDATLSLLPQVASHLLAIFAADGAADFSEATLRALRVLGDAEDPSQLLLSVDYQLAHLLVDEFQDTSWIHRELIERLTSGWERGDGRTLFAVGDPMQSIYRFREAEVGIFLEAQATSIVAGIDVECLDLASNFRSEAPIIDWVNAVFPQVLPPVSDPARGEVAYKRVLATRAGDTAPTLDVVGSRQDEVKAVVHRIRAAQADGAKDIAVLVQARKHLDLILPALRNDGIEYIAIELETLAQRLATRDLVALARMLTQPADRLASLAVLRAPWCALSLPDLLALAEDEDNPAILDAIADPHVVGTLSPDGRARVARLRAALQEPLAQRGRVALARRVRAAWLALGGPACGDGAIDASGAQRFFALLAQHERAGDISDWDVFVAATEKLFAEPASRGDASVQVMTIHKAKGLEFDTVILPGLDRRTSHGDEPALRWKRRDHAGIQALLLAPLRAREGARSAPDPVYQYLKFLDTTEALAERGRLLYVGCTRARRRLHLVAALKIKPPKAGEPRGWSKPAQSSALAQLWPAVQGDAAPPPASLAAERAAQDQEPPEIDAANADERVTETAEPDGDEVAPQAQSLRRLSLEWRLPVPVLSIESTLVAQVDGVAQVAFDWAHATAAAIGTIAHRILARIADDGLAIWDAARLDKERGRITIALAQEGVPAEERVEATQRVEAAVRRTLADARGRWLFDPSHTEAHSEWALAGMEGATLRHITLDRTLVADGVRWIVDFKTGRHEGGEAAAFLDSEVERYRSQLVGYARIVRELDPRPIPLPIRLALYFPLVDGGWREWAYSG